MIEFMMTRKLFVWLPVILCMVVIFAFSSQSGEVSNDLSKELTQEIVLSRDDGQRDAVNIVNLNFIVRKVAHFALYFLLGLTIINALTVSGVVMSRSVIAGLLLCILFAFSDELHQMLIPGRDARWQDVLIDSLGAFAGIILYRLGVAVWFYRKTMPDTR